jgi:hypothetical protein
MRTSNGSGSSETSVATHSLAITATETPVVEESHCARCEKPFKAKRRWQRFCSSVCRYAEWSGRNPRQASLSERLDRIEAKIDMLLMLEKRE